MMMHEPWIWLLLLVAPLIVLGGLFVAVRVYGARKAAPDHRD